MMTEPESQLYVCRVTTPEGDRDYVTLLPPDVIFETGLIPEAIVGALSETLEAGGGISPDRFTRNRVFVEFLHQVIARHAPSDPACIAEARRVGSGWILVVDQRTPTPGGDVPPEDIIGALAVENGEILPHSFEPSPNHLILSFAGFFQLDEFLQSCLMDELADRTSQAEWHQEPPPE